MAATRTLNPLHFEDLEPHRFEDLVRQLAYDFTTWRRLEATGRSGSDSGFDARGWQIVNFDPAEDAPADDDDGEQELALRGPVADRLWLIQCKREKKVGPKQLLAYLDDIPEAERSALHGIIFAAAADFSKTARDAFANRVATFGVREWQLWGRGELEDLLLQPKNDHLLFAYFGISLVIRQRATRSQVRARLAAKRKAHRALGGFMGRALLLRDPENTIYPYSGDLGDTSRDQAWIVRRFAGFEYDGIAFLLRRHFAYLTVDGAWDAVEAHNDALTPSEDPWADVTPAVSRQAIWTHWESLGENRAWLQVIGIVDWDRLHDIDAIGDDYMPQTPHIYVDLRNGPPYKRWEASVSRVRGDLPPKYLASRITDRVEIFPKVWPNEAPTSIDPNNPLGALPPET